MAKTHSPASIIARNTAAATATTVTKSSWRPRTRRSTSFSLPTVQPLLSPEAELPPADGLLAAAGLPLAAGLQVADGLPHLLLPPKAPTTNPNGRPLPH